VLVNYIYIGDELVAMWGAPSDQADQGLLACRTALAMHQTFPSMNKRWSAQLGKPFRLGIGINTGMAKVGNTGSKRKLQYGPLGNTVNLASRVQGMTRYLGVDLLVTAATQARLTPDLATRRRCKARVVNIDEPVDLYELRPQSDDAWHALRESYEAALIDFEQQEFRSAAEVLGRLISQFPDDRPSLVLLSRAVQLLNSSGALDPTWDSSWVPGGK
jgi:adenylate cyclase